VEAVATRGIDDPSPVGTSSSADLCRRSSLGLVYASAGEICLAAEAYLDGRADD
jgi:hypothetical protein